MYLYSLNSTDLQTGQAVLDHAAVTGTQLHPTPTSPSLVCFYCGLTRGNRTLDWQPLRNNADRVHTIRWFSEEEGDMFNPWWISFWLWALWSESVQRAQKWHVKREPGSTQRKRQHSTELPASVLQPLYSPPWKPFSKPTLGTLPALKAFNSTI